MDQTLLHFVICDFSASRWSGSLALLSEGFKHHHGKAFFFFFFFPLLCSSVESTQWPGMKTTSHEREERGRADESSSTDEIFTTEEVHSWTEMLPCLLSVLFLTWHRGTCFPLCCPIYAISEGEVITQGWGGMFLILSSLPARLLEIRLLSGQLKDGACWGRPVWQRPKRGMPQREQWGFDPYLFTISL